MVTESTTLKPKRDNKTKGEMENLIKINGGKIFQNEKTAPNTYVIGDRRMCIFPTLSGSI